MSHADDGRQSRRSSVAKVPSDGLSDGSTHDGHRSRQSKTSQEFTCLEAFANPKRENWCDVRDDDSDGDDQDLWLSASPFKEATTEAPATPSRHRPAPRRRSKRDSPREEIQHSQGRPEAVQQPAQIPGSVVTIADIGLPCGAPPAPPCAGACGATSAAAKAMPTPPMWPGIMSTSPIEQPRPAVFLPCGAIGASGGPPARSPMNGGSLPVGSPTGDASTRAIYSGSPTFMGPPMTPMTPVDPSLRPAQWPDASPVYQPCAWPWPPAGVQPQPGMAPMAPMAPAGVAPMMAPPTWPQEPQWNPGSMPAWQGCQGCQGVQQGPPGTYMVMGDGMAGYVANMEA